MGIEVRCPNGHEFKVKDKYAGKKGLCPFCEGEVKVRVPDASTSKALADSAYKIAAQQHGGAAAAAAASVFDDDDPASVTGSASASGSMLGSSVIRHNVKCKCGAKVPMWFARCPQCGEYMQQS
ncbi:MAG: hypothetical protein AAGA92_12300 [Planctomycetota bacterium]